MEKLWLERWEEGMASWLARSPMESPEEYEKERQQVLTMLREKSEEERMARAEKWGRRLREGLMRLGILPTSVEKLREIGV